MQQQAAKALLTQLPAKIGSFDGSDYPLPIKTTIVGDHALTVDGVRAAVMDHIDGDVKYLVEPLLVAAEVIEASQPDRADYFLRDGAVQSHVFMGSKWQAGWVLVLGARHREALIPKLKERGFAVFVDAQGIPDTVYIGERDTSPIYFLQMMVRYGLIWGSIAPGDAHEMGHFLERDMPGFLVIAEDLPPVKYLLTLGLMKLGAPAVVPSSFPFPYGTRVVADTVDEIIERGSRFPNLRRRYHKDEIIQHPPYVNPAFAQEKFETARRLGGTPASFFCVKPAEVIGEPLTVIGTQGPDIGILVEIAEEGFTDDLALLVEPMAIKALSFFKGMKAYDKKGALVIELAEGVAFEPDKAAEVIRRHIRLSYPRLEHIGVTVIFDPVQCALVTLKVIEYKAGRRAFVDAMTEENTDIFCVCTECRPFSLVHTCIVTPDRTPMCASRTYASIKAGALFGSVWDPMKRTSEENLELRSLITRGKTVDAARGEYEGANEAYARMTGGKLNRAFLHSVRDYPHTSCGCFQALAFWIPEVNGIGVMGRGSQAKTPDGSTWEMLANRAGGKQTAGIMGVSVAYIRSRHFLKGDGGISNLVWVDSGLLPKIKDVIPAGQRVATERDAVSLQDLATVTGRDSTVTA
jgi:CO dehydrogenase/acetyl-CoA synthase beta subunit